MNENKPQNQIFILNTGSHNLITGLADGESSQTYGLDFLAQNTNFVQENPFEKERKQTKLNDLEQKTLEILKEKAFYKITLTPMEYEINKDFTLQYFRDSLKNSAVRSRGWQYPYVGKDENFSSNSNGNVGYVKTRFSSNIDNSLFPKHEITTAYRSGQVVYSFSADEDWRDGFEENGTAIKLTVFKLADVIEFLSRYINKFQQIYKKGVHLEFKFYNPSGYRVLYFGEWGYIDDAIDNINYNKVTEITCDFSFDELSKGYKEVSAKITHSFFENFNTNLHINDVIRIQEEAN